MQALGAGSAGTTLALGPVLGGVVQVCVHTRLLQPVPTGWGLLAESYPAKGSGV